MLKSYAGLQERKCSAEGLGLMELTPTVRFPLIALRAYLIAITLLIFYHTLTLAQVFTHHAH
jgi:hypothetical protein